MRSNRNVLFSFFAVCCALSAVPGVLSAQPTSTPQHHVFFRVQVPATLTAPVSGRLLIFLKHGSADREVNIDEFHPSDTAVAAMDVRDLAPGSAIELNADQIAFPKPFSTLAQGNYEVQAALDPDHSYTYSGRSPQDLISPVLPLANWTPGVGDEPALTLDHHPEENPQRTAAMAKLKDQAKPDVAQFEEFESPLLTRFWGRSVKFKAWVILPPGYSEQAREKYPTAYWTHGFGGDIDGALAFGMRLSERMKNHQMPSIIWVMLDESIPQGTHEFADSVNNGPWGTALTTEFIPHLESKYHMDARPSGRLLNGHSSGGWATLQLQVNYPKVFGGTWSTSPDPSDFHDFTGADLYAPNANIYRKPDGTAMPIMRDKGKVVATFETLSRLEEVLGPYGGQVASFEWVFSPKGPDGSPEPMFDRATGNVDPKVVAYWHDHYDLAHVTEANWTQRKAYLKGRIHLFVGTADTFYLDGAAHKFEAVLTRLGANPHFTYVPDRTHFDLYGIGKDRMGLFDQIAAEMYAVARPKVNWKAAQAPAK